MSSIARNSAIDSAAQIGNVIISLATGVVVARLLGAVGRGEYVLATGFAGFFLIAFVNFGLDLAARVLVAKDPARTAQVHTLVVAFCLVVAAVAGAGLTVGFDFLQQYVIPGIARADLFFIVLSLPLWCYQIGVFGILTGLGEVRRRAIFELVLSFIQNGLVVVLLAAMVHKGEAVIVRAMVATYYAIVMISSVLAGVVLARRTALWATPSAELLREFFRFGGWVYVGNMGTNLGQRIDQYFVQQISRDAGIFGVYTLATSLTARTRIFAESLSRSSYPRLAALPQPEAARLTAACFRQMFALGLIMFVGGAVTAPLLPIIYSRDFAAAVLPFQIFLAGRLFHNCAWMLANYFSAHMVRPEIPTAVNWLILPVQAVLAYLAMKHGGLVAVAAITSASYTLLFVGFLVLFLRYQKTVGMRELFVLHADDLKPWKALFRKLAGR